MAAPPTIPPRPARAQNSSASPANMDMPKIPPRPKRSVDRSISPHRDTFARSPLNDPAFLHNNKQQHKESYLSAEVPARPPSVSLPDLGQEGSEYASFEDLSKTLTNQSEAPQETKNVAGDLPLYAPKAAVPSSTAKSRIQTVTRTDSNQAAAHGLGKLMPEDKQSAQSIDSGRSVSSAGGTSRPSSMYKDDEEHGIPEIGVQVPMYPNAGDVQAPTPSPYDQAVSTGIGFHNKGGQPSGRHHGRTKSGREIFTGPPGSYGRHGHGKISKDEFEQKWYEKHPEDHKREKAGEYGPHIQENRKDYHWKGDDLDKLVHRAGAKGHGLGTSREAIGTPDEQIGYIAHEEYASRMGSPRPTSGRPSSISGKSGITAESPLRQANFPADQLTKQKTHESETEEDVIHIDPPTHRTSKIGGGGYDPPTEDLGPEGGNTDKEGGWVSERGYGVPILASDEIEKHPEAEWRQPAISPELERRGSGEYTANEDGTPSYITKQRTHSRSSSRNNSVQLNAPQRFIPSPHHDRSGTPLESHKEYEPLFPEDEEVKPKPKTAADKLKRPDLARHHFPSQDVWEDTPSSLQLQTTVETPEAPGEVETPGDVSTSKPFEKPEVEEARKENATKTEQQSFLPEQTKRFTNKHLHKEHLDQPGRPGMQQRFPSRDIWEDAPDHGYLETTVSTPQMDDTTEYADDSPVVEKPTIPARPSVPARPQKKEISPVEKKAPVIPERPKPQVPARPSKTLTKSSEKGPTLESQAADNEVPQPKVKPQVPARPGGSKIAALQAGFLKDLNSKIGLGPQAPKVKDPEPDKEEEPPKPLSDARKGRAKGPQRRKPTASPAPAATVTAEVAVPPVKLDFAPVSTVWSIGDDGDVDVPASKLATALQEKLAVSEDVPSVAKEVLEKRADSEPEEAELAKITTKESEPASTVESIEPALEKTATKESTKSLETRSAKMDDDDDDDDEEEEEEEEEKGEGEAETTTTGGVPLEKDVSVDVREKVTLEEGPQDAIKEA